MNAPTKSPTSRVTWLPDTRHLNMGEVAAKVHTNSVLRREGGIAFASKSTRDRLDQARSTCHLCDAPIRFDGIVWVEVDQRDAQKAYRCRVGGQQSRVRRPHEPSELREKHLARARVLELVTRKYEGRSLRILTMPGAQWSFEHLLLMARLRHKTRAEKKAQRTTIYAVESVDAVYRASLATMPSRQEGVRTTTPPEWATFQIATESIQGYYRGDIFAAVGDIKCDAAWVDLTGQLTPRSVKHLVEAWRSRQIAETLVITSLKGRWEGPLAQVIAAAGGAASWLQEVFEREASDVFEYAEPAPMLQVAFDRPLIHFPGGSDEGAARPLITATRLGGTSAR